MLRNQGEASVRIRLRTIFAAILLGGCASAIPLVADDPAIAKKLQGNWKGEWISYTGGGQGSLALKNVNVSGERVDGEAVWGNSGYRSGGVPLNARLEKGALKSGDPELQGFVLKLYESSPGVLELKGEYSNIIGGRMVGGYVRLSKEP